MTATTNEMRGSEPPSGYVTAAEIAARLAAVTGRRDIPASTIRAMAARGQFPKPTDLRWNRRALWKESVVAAELVRRGESLKPPKHVVRRFQRRLARLDDGAREHANPEALRKAVREARTAGLSWEAIAEGLTAPHGGHPSREAARRRFKRYVPDTSSR